mmetsp:Transcript_58953/g.120702  ORF Transcript_58953/g.120702 Transcript_58953/m.120702 type:complete len:454 (+) Transcript_58953:16-1377(+)
MADVYTPLLGSEAKPQPKGRRASLVCTVENETGLTQHEWRIRKTNYFIALCSSALLGLLIAVVVNETLWYSAVGFETMDTGITTVMKILVFISTTSSFVLLFLYYDALINIQRSQGVELTAGFNFFSLYETRHLWMFIWDFFILLPQPFPLLHFTIGIPDLEHLNEPTVYTSDNMFVALMFLRVTLLPRLVAEIALKGRDMAHVMARMGNIQLDTWFVIRSLFIANFSAILWLIGTLVFSMSYLILLAERPYPHVDQLSNFDSCLWLTIITMTTVGYGDVVVQTRMGRVISTIVACLGVVTVSLIINGVVARMKMDPREQRIVDWIDRSEVRTQLRSAASRTIQTVFRTYRMNKQMLLSGSKPKRLRVHPRIRAELTSFRWAKREATAEIGDPMINMMQQVQFLAERLQRMETMMEEVHANLIPQRRTSAARPPSAQRVPSGGAAAQTEARGR